MSHKPTIFTYLTREEWKTCFALAFLADTEYESTVNLRPYQVEGKERTWESAIIAAVRFLALEHGFKFEGVGVREEDQEILAFQREPVCEGNRIYLDLLALGKLPNIPAAMRTAIRLLNERAPDFNTEPLREALADVEAARDTMLATTDSEELKHTERFIDHALAAIGVERVKAS